MMAKLIARLVVMLILFGVSLMFFGSGFTTYLLNTGTSTITSFALLFSSASAGEATVDPVIDFIFGFIQSIGIILFYFLIAHVVAGIFTPK
jgi:hypothetical protein